MAVKFNDIEFAREWLKSIDTGGLEYMQGKFHASRQEISAHASMLRKKLKAIGVELPQQSKPGRSSSVSNDTLADIADLVRDAANS